MRGKAAMFVCTSMIRICLAELREHKVALQELKQRLEEWDAKQAIWTQLHEELANAHETNKQLELDVAIARQAQVNAENKPPVIVTETVTVEKVRNCKLFGLYLL